MRDMRREASSEATQLPIGFEAKRKRATRRLDPRLHVSIARLMPDDGDRANVDAFVAAAFPAIATVFAHIAERTIIRRVARAFAPIATVFDAVRAGQRRSDRVRLSGRGDHKGGDDGGDEFHDVSPTKAAHRLI
jgi:hypothetical protein